MTSAQDPSAALRRDSRIALYSIVGFWSFYFLINSVRSLVMGDPNQVQNLGNRVVVASLSMVITGLFYLFIRRSSAASMRRSMVTAAILALPAAATYATLNWFVFEGSSPQPARHAVLSPPPPPRAPLIALGAPAPPPPPGETLNVGHTAWEHEMTPLQAIVETTASGYFFFVAWASLFLSLSYAGEVRVLERRSAELRAAAQSAELRALRYQVNPHFLFNTLNSLSSLIMTGKRAEAERMIINLATFFRTSLTGDPTEDVPLSDEIALQRLYLDIEAIRFPDRLLVDIDLPDALASAQVPGLILQPLVENAVKHGVSRTAEPVTIAIAARERANRLVLTVANSGAGPCAPGRADGTGVGLRNVRDRLTVRFGENGQCRWRAPTGGSFEVELSMPIMRNGR